MNWCPKCTLYWSKHIQNSQTSAPVIMCPTCSRLKELKQTHPQFADDYEDLMDFGLHT